MFAIAFGAFMLCAETCLHLGEMIEAQSWTDFPIHDWAAGGFLIVAGVLARKNPRQGLSYQAAAWAFMASLLSGAFVGVWEEWVAGAPPEFGISPGTFVAIVAALLIGSLWGLIATLANAQRPSE